MSDVSGSLLLAVPELLDPNFHRTVVFVIEHTEHGAYGVVVNRPTTLEVSTVLPDAEVSPPGLVFDGGPVQREAAIALGRSGSPPEGWSPLPIVPSPGLADVGLVDVDHAMTEGWPRLDALRIYAGHSGWSPGQLDAELEEGGWIVVNATPQDVFAADPERVYLDAIERAGGSRSLYGNLPPDLRLN